jgi:3-hydroxyacyl-CoA dehydrogenase/enoyl-CoA hydratase/3-hydroxybutyryl-CoA epimerase
MSFFQAENLRIDLENRIAILRLDVKDRPLNVFNRAALADLSAALDHLASAAPSEVTRLVITSAKPSGFLSGADVREFQHIRSPEEATALSKVGQDLFARVEALPMPSVALITGPCLGGGLELALSCDYRIAIDQPKTKLGLPEIMLGLLPAWGGTQRLPRVVGVERAFQIILGRKTLNAVEANKWGLIDQVLPKTFDPINNPLGCLPDVSPMIDGKRPKEKLPRRNWWHTIVESTGFGRSFVFRGAESILAKKTPDDMPAPREAFEAVRIGITEGAEAGFTYERAAVGRLATTRACRNMVALFFEREAAKEMPPELKDIPAREIKKVAVVGAGTMGAGIAQLAAVRGCQVVVREVDDMTLGMGMFKILGLFKQAVDRGVMTKEEADRKLEGIKGTTSWDGFADADLVIEAVLEKLELKRKVFRELEAHVRPDAILATNTSSLGVANIAEGLSRPERVGALHFFNPVHKMPLVEVGHIATTTRENIAALTHWTLRMGKTPVVVKDSPGFVVNRILIPYLNEAVLLVAEGLSIKDVDTAAKRFGMLMGPLEVIDQVGIDVGAHIARSLQPAFSERFPPNPAFEALLARGWLGQKNGRGFYVHTGKKHTPNAEAEALVREAVKSGSGLLMALPEETRRREAAERMMLLTVNEAAMTVSDGLVAHPDLIDRAMVFGSGWAPHRGGPLRYADDRGLDDVTRALVELAGRHGPRFEPCSELKRRSESGEKFRTPLPA